MKLQKTPRGTFLLSIPKDVKKALGWDDDQKLSLCPDQATGTLRIIPLKGV